MSFHNARDHWPRLYMIVLAAGLATGLAAPLGRADEGPATGRATEAG